ncbi:MAG: hypothetical protein KDB61_08315 [Planctomycetes bacterium]|nr:hypothetical protein [Planctomycetota bacterium]
MNPAVLRALLGLLAILGAMFAPDRGEARLDSVQREQVWTCGHEGKAGSGEESGWKLFAALGETASVASAAPEESGDGPHSTAKKVARKPWPRSKARALKPQQYGALAPGERPAALAYLRKNGSANANGTGT